MYSCFKIRGQNDVPRTANIKSETLECRAIHDNWRVRVRRRRPANHQRPVHSTRLRNSFGLGWRLRTASLGMRGHLVRQALASLIMAAAFDATVDALVPLVSNGLDALPAVRYMYLYMDCLLKRRQGCSYIRHARQSGIICIYIVRIPKKLHVYGAVY